MKNTTLQKLCKFLLFASVIINFSCKKDNLEIKPAALLNGWEITQSNLDFEINPRDLFFVNSETGFVVGYNGAIYKTNNAGKTWQKQDSNTLLHLFSVFFLDEKVGFVGGQGMNCLDVDCGKGSVFLKTMNGGETWTKIFFKEYVRIYSLIFFDELNGLALIDTPDIPNSRDYSIAKTSDGGTSWEFISLPIRPNNKFFFVDNTVWIAGENQKIFKSKDYGNNWETLSTPVPASSNIRSIYFYNENVGFIDGGTSFYKTQDGGLTWHTISFPFTTMGIFHFYNEMEGFNINNISQNEGEHYPTFKGSRSYQTFNGGASWESSALNNTLFGWLAFFPNRDLGYGISGKHFFTFKKD